MSGLAVLLEKEGTAASAAVVSAMLARLAPRGPDRQGHYADGPVALAQCMLETTPEDAWERQPLRSAERDLWLVADARIDNRAELATRLGLAADEARGVPDSAFILRAYQLWGEATPEHLVGDFAFAIWDGARRSLFCARDALGVRPLYYLDDGRTFRAASEMAALFADTRVSRRVRKDGVTLFLVNAYAEDDETLYEGVRVLPAGSSLTVGSGAPRVRAYWRPDSRRTIREKTDDAYAEGFHEQFAEAVRCRLRVAGPLAAEVSGGLDSSSIACEAWRLRRDGAASAPAPQLMRITFPGLGCDESPFSQAVADRVGAPIYSANALERTDLASPTSRRTDCYFEPTACWALLEEASRRGIRVTLTGVGGDQLMDATGHEVVSHLRRARVVDAAREVALDRRPLSRGAWRAMIAGGVKAAVPQRVLGAIRRARVRKSVWPWLPQASARMAADRLAEELRRTSELHPDPVQATLRYDLMHGPSTPYALALGDRAMAAFGQEARYPFLDRRVVEHLLALPNEQRFLHGRQKPVLRRAMRGVLPDSVRERGDKADFGCYVQRAFWEPHASLVRALLARSTLEELGIVDGDEVRRELDATEVDIDLCATLTAMELWVRDVCDPERARNGNGHAG